MQTLDARGKSCPMPIVLMAKAVKAVNPGDRVCVLADDRAFPEDVRAWCNKTGHELVSLADKAGHYEAEVRRSR